MNKDEERFEKIFLKYGDHIKENEDLYGNQSPSFLFPFLGTTFRYLLEDDPNITITSLGVKARKSLHGIVKLVGPYFLPCKQVFEDRNLLRDIHSTEKDSGIVLPDKPVIWAPNHSFRWDTLASLLAASRHSYMVIGNLPEFYNTLNGIPIFINGVILVNRRRRESRQAVLEKGGRVIDFGSDLILFPEGIGHKSPNALALHLFPGVYKIAKEKNVSIVPIVHYKENTLSSSKDDIIHTVVDDPIDVSNMSQEEALTVLKDTYAYWKYLMMERYGQSTRAKELGEYVDSNLYWEDQLKNRPRGRYDDKVEKATLYFEKDYYDVLEKISALDVTPENVLLVEDAKKLVKSNYQKRF